MSNKPFATNSETVGLLSANAPSLGAATPAIATDSQATIPASLCGVLSVSFYAQVGLVLWVNYLSSIVAHTFLHVPLDGLWCAVLQRRYARRCC
jgi:hypothetical protein